VPETEKTFAALALVLGVLGTLEDDNTLLYIAAMLAAIAFGMMLSRPGDPR
jgi:hypothetical protein